MDNNNKILLTDVKEKLNDAFTNIMIIFYLFLRKSVF